MQFFSFLTIFGALLVCSNAAHVHTPRHKQGPSQGFSLASNRFGLDMLQQIGQQNDAQSQRMNILFSPYSVAVAMSMVHQGAGGQSAEQLRKVLRFTDDDTGINGGEPQKVGQSVHEVIEQLQQQSSDGEPRGYNLSSGNLVLVDEQLHVKDQYNKMIRESFGGEVQSVDFKKDSEGIKERVNKFVSEKTNGMINPMLEQAPSGDSVMALLNAVYFKGEWAKKFDQSETKTGVFYGDNGQQYQGVQFMNSQSRYPFAAMDDIDADMVIVPYKGDEVSFIGILPRNREADLSQIRRSLNISYIEQTISQVVRFQESKVIIPRMELSTTYDLPQTLQSMGIKDIFDSNADLSGISEDKKLVLSRAIHKAKMIMNEEGTEASASTYLEIAVMALPIAPPTFRFDHPFMYLIRHHGTGQILFLGEVHQF